MSFLNFFELGGVTVPLNSVTDFTQRYPDLGSFTDHEMMDGSVQRQENFDKIQTVLSGKGWIPAGLDGLDYTSPMLLKCAAAKMISSPSNVIVLPSERRSDTDFEPRGYAVVNGVRTETTINVVTNTATLGAVPGASYQVEYFPEITVLARLTESSAEVTNANFSWRIDARQST